MQRPPPGLGRPSRLLAAHPHGATGWWLRRSSRSWCPHRARCRCRSPASRARHEWSLECRRGGTWGAVSCARTLSSCPRSPGAVRAPTWRRSAIVARIVIATPGPAVVVVPTPPARCCRRPLRRGHGDGLIVAGPEREPEHWDGEQRQHRQSQRRARALEGLPPRRPRRRHLRGGARRGPQTAFAGCPANAFGSVAHSLWFVLSRRQANSLQGPHPKRLDPWRRSRWPGSGLAVQARRRRCPRIRAGGAATG